LAPREWPTRCCLSSGAGRLSVLREMPGVPADGKITQYIAIHQPQEKEKPQKKKKVKVVVAKVVVVLWPRLVRELPVVRQGDAEAAGDEVHDEEAVERGPRCSGTSLKFEKAKHLKTGDHFTGRLKGQAQGLRPGAFKLRVNFRAMGQLDGTCIQPHHVKVNGASRHPRCITPMKEAYVMSVFCRALGLAAFFAIVILRLVTKRIQQ
jgi:hypothetical protein